MKMSGVENPKKITLFISESWHYDFFKELKNEIEIKQNRNVKELMHYFLDKYPDHKETVSKIITSAIKNPSLLSAPDCQNKEFSIYMFARDFFSKCLECNIEVIKAEGSNHPKAKACLPGKVGILVE
jgi:hypothetical protein